MFTKIEGGTAVLRSRGVYRPCDLYRLPDGDAVYAKYGSGFIRLTGHNETTVPHVKVASIVTGANIGFKRTVPYVS